MLLFNMDKIKLKDNEHFLVALDKKMNKVQISANKDGFLALARIFTQASESFAPDDLFGWDDFAEIKSNNLFGDSNKNILDLTLVKVKG